MMLFKKAIPRRAFLKGAGATLALPLLESMTPAFAGALDSAAKPATRLSIVYVPNGRIMDSWTPSAEGAAFEMTPILEPLAPFRNQLLVLTGLSNKPAEIRKGESTGPHSRAGATFLTGIHMKPGTELGISVDQLAANELGKHTQLSSLELTLESGETGAGADGADTEAYLNTISWRSPTTPLPVENNPRAVFERLFGESDTNDPAEHLRRIRKDRSILDSVAEDVARLMGGVGTGDRAKLAEYLDGIRDVERRIEKAEGMSASSKKLPVLDRPAGLPVAYDEHAKLMFDLQALAYQTDMTRVGTFCMAREKSERSYREIGIDEGHHALTHHGGDKSMIARVVQINIFQCKMFAHFLEKLRSTPDGDGSLLDHSVIMFASSLSDGNAHAPTNLPVLLAGGGAGRIKGGRHIRYAKDTPLTNLFLTMLDMTGVRVDRFADSTGELELLSV